MMARERRAAARLLVLAMIAALSAAVFAPVPAGAQDAAPTPCTGILYTDPAADEQSGPDALGMPAQSPNTIGEDPYIDINGFFFNYKPGADGKPVLTANFQLRDLTVAIPDFPDSYDGHAEYFVEFDHIGAVDWVRAYTDGTDWTYEYGKVTDARIPDGTFVVRSRPTATTGRVFPGPNGIVQVDFPADAEIVPGAKIGKPTAYTGIWTASLEGQTGFWLYSDRAPDANADRVDYTIADCPVTETQQNGGGTNTNPGTPGPANPGPAQPGPQQPAAPTTLPFKVRSASLGSAKKALKARRLSAKVASTRLITGLKVTLKSGKKTVASGSLSKLEGNATMKLKLAGKRLKKGRYTLVAVGTVDGRRLTATQRVKLGK